MPKILEAIKLLLPKAANHAAHLRAQADRMERTARNHRMAADAMEVLATGGKLLPAWEAAIAYARQCRSKANPVQDGARDWAFYGQANGQPNLPDGALVCSASLILSGKGWEGYSADPTMLAAFGRDTEGKPLTVAEENNRSKK